MNNTKTDMLNLASYADKAAYDTISEILKYRDEGRIPDRYQIAVEDIMYAAEKLDAAAYALNRNAKSADPTETSENPGKEASE